MMIPNNSTYPFTYDFEVFKYSNILKARSCAHATYPFTYDFEVFKHSNLLQARSSAHATYPFTYDFEVFKYSNLLKARSSAYPAHFVRFQEQENNMSEIETIARLIRESSSSVNLSGAAQTSMPRALCITGTTLPCTSSGFEAEKKHHFFECTVLGFTNTGFTQVPIAHTNGKFVQDRKTAKSLCEFVPDSNQTSVRCYNWAKMASTFAKGARIDGSDPNVLEGRDMSWTLSAGDVLSCRLDPERAPGGSMFKQGEKAAFTYPSEVEGGVIPAFSLVEVDLDLKSWSRVPKDSVEDQVSACAKGYALGIRGVRTVCASVNSQRTVMQSCVPTAIEESYERQRAKGAQNEHVSGVFNSTKGCFYLPTVASEAYCVLKEDDDFIGLHEGVSTNVPKIDLLRASTYRAINCTTDEDANAFMDIAVASGSVSVFGHCNDFRSRGDGRSNTFGVPIIDACNMLRGVVPEGDISTDPSRWEFDAGFSMQFTDEIFKPIVIRIYKEILTNLGNREDSTVSYPYAIDMPLVSPGFRLDKAYQIVFAFQGADIVWSGFLNASKGGGTSSASAGSMVTNAIAAAGKRRSWGGALPPCVPLPPSTRPTKKSKDTKD
jgi:hypothetical protein